MERQPCIYMIKNMVNNKVYIGQTVRSFKSRKVDHISRLRGNYCNNFYLQNAFNKYGENNMQFSILELCDHKNIDEREIYWINQYNSCNRLYGYNLESGGNSNKKLSVETKEKISKRSKENVLNGKCGFTPQKVICLDDMNVFESAKEASEYYGIKYRSLIYVLNGNGRLCRNINGEYFQFKRYTEDEIYKKEDIDIKNKSFKKKVKCLNTGIIYDSTKQAARATGFMQSKISLVCNGKRNYHGKDEKGNPIKWEFVE